ncbi:PREDICTED: CRM-domain containing factor CFM2, chloroplastic isoform X2 [Ipomoea nil]|uniref:CRM-domain containing factor CFM2, chloroplastic isoform X2 n=1 Tax=Ipomoea nil TaxID=35883 RepID=UPI0009017295|nr:PREDICTED: CRM-domain containing factor CFM2, chloroplastic isoform X2 [Ipomoea nil]
MNSVFTLQMLHPLCNYRPLHQPRTLPNPSSESFFSFPLPTSQSPVLRRRVELGRASVVVSAADTKAVSQSAIERIAEKLRSLGYVEDNGQKGKREETRHLEVNSASPGQIFVPLPTQLPKYRVGHTLDPSWSTPENPVPQPGSGNAIQRFHDMRNELLKAKEEERVKKKDKAPSLAELTVPAKELSRLRMIGIALKQKINVGKAGITEGIVNGIHERWRRSEVVKIKCKEMCRLNMKRTHDMLERQTGGLVVWRSGGTIILYRGADYKYPYFLSDDTSSNDVSIDVHMDCGGDDVRETSSVGMDGVKSAGLNGGSYPSLVKGVGSPNKVRFELPGEGELAEEADRLLEGLGPRFTDWWGYYPLPVDADLLPAVVPGYRRPFRLLPYGVKPILTNDEMTTLKRLARPLRCHFALSRNRKLQGLAAAIVKLWEKCEIAKIAVKRGAQNTNSELMAEELKLLTGGVLLARDKEFITLYRGKDFLPAAVSSAIEERRKQAIREKHRKDYNSQVADVKELTQSREAVQPIVEFASEDENTGKNNKNVVPGKKQLNSTEAAIERTTNKLKAALEKKAKAEKLLEDLDKEEISEPPDLDKEGLTEEERYMLRRVGLRMKAFLLLGRRGVFDGTVENMHLHWKYRELVKIIAGRRSIGEVQQIARMLERESGGILVAIEQTSKGYAIIVYRGKNYTRPASLRPQTLLSKKQAMKRSIEAQRRKSLKLHVLKLNRNIQDLKLKLVKDREINDVQLRELKAGEACINKSKDTMHPAQQELQQGLSIQSENKAEVEFDTSEPENWDKSSTKEIKIVLNSDDGSCAKDQEINDVQPRESNVGEEELQRDFYVQSENKAEVEFDTSEPQHWDKLSGNEIENMPNLEADDGSSGTPSNPHCSREDQISPEILNRTRKSLDFDMKSMVPHVGSLKTEVEHYSMENRSNDVPSRTVQLSNKERLVLRKQALKTKKRPVIAVGRSNIVTGVAKVIKTHFQKHPLAIVNVKGRAKGTSAREVAYKLEQATGAILVSLEPNKVILYRGWGAEGEATRGSGGAPRDLKTGEQKVRPPISPELLSAIRLECGLPLNQEEAKLQ